MSILIDSAQDARNLLAQVQQALGGNPAAWARYLGTGGGAATPLTAAEAQALLDAGIAILPVYNDSPLNGGAAATYAQGQADAQQAISQAQALRVPTETYLICDIEFSALSALTGDYLAGWADTMRAGPYAGAGGVYANLLDPRFSTALDAALTRSQNVGRMLWWLASWISQGDAGIPATPAWDASSGPTGLPWSASYLANVVAWQYAGSALGGAVDVSLIHLPLPAPGGLWVPKADTTTATLAAQVASLQEQLAAAQASNQVLSQRIAAAKAALG